MRRATLEKLMEARREGRTLVRALNLASGEERLLDPASDSSPLDQAAARAMRQDTCLRITLEGGDWLLTVYHAPWEIVVVGAVHIAQALAALAIPAGYRVRVIDPRAPYATDERFPGISLQRAWPDEALAAEPLTPHSALVVLAHDAKLDDSALAHALPSPAFYIGALGSTRTHSRRLARLAAQGFSQFQLARIHGPVGLAIGAGTDVAIETADVVLMRSDPLDVAVALAIGKGTVRKMRQNLGWAVGYNAIALPIAAGLFMPAFGLMLRPEIAALAMSGSSFLVAMNALLLKRLRLPGVAAQPAPLMLPAVADGGTGTPQPHGPVQ